MTTLAVLGRGLLPRWKAVCVIVACILAFLLMGVAMVQSMDTNVYASLPPALLAMAGIPAGAFWQNFKQFFGRFELVFKHKILVAAHQLPCVVCPTEKS